MSTLRAAIQTSVVALASGAAMVLAGSGVAHAHGTFEPPTTPRPPLTRAHQGPYSVLHQHGPFSVLHPAR